MHAVDCDLTSFFDSVNHERLIGQLRGKIRCRKTLGLIRRYLEAGAVVLPDGTREATPQGVPQGGPLSPLLWPTSRWTPWISDTYTAFLELDEWVRRRVGLYDWKQWKQPRTRRRCLRALGIPRDEVPMATRSRKGYWRMSANILLQRAFTNRWRHEQGVPDMRTLWIVLHDGPKARR